MKIFISYSRKDEVWKDRLLKHLTPLQRSGELDVWEDSQITVGAKWFPCVFTGQANFFLGLLLKYHDRHVLVTFGKFLKILSLENGWKHLL